MVYVALQVLLCPIIIVAGDKSFFIDKKILVYIRVMLGTWLFIAILAYSKAGISGITSLIYNLSVGDDLNSSTLYATAGPVEKIFLTKNISSMFMVAVYSIYVYVSMNTKESVSNVVSALFLLIVFLFMSRQGLLAFLIVFFYYKYFTFGKFGKSLTIGVLFCSMIYVFSKLFNLNNSEDGASQRVELWMFFFENYNDFLLFGVGQEKLSSILNTYIGIDNFHMFFMNQIGVYGVFHFLSFSFFLIIVYLLGSGQHKLVLVFAYMLNVLFQTFGYEYGNLVLFLVMLLNFKNKDVCGQKELSVVR